MDLDVGGANDKSRRMIRSECARRLLLFTDFIRNEDTQRHKELARLNQGKDKPLFDLGLPENDPVDRHKGPRAA
jgi:hypothetical protein